MLKAFHGTTFPPQINLTWGAANSKRHSSENKAIKKSHEAEEHNSYFWQF